MCNGYNDSKTNAFDAKYVGRQIEYVQSGEPRLGTIVWSGIVDGPAMTVSTSINGKMMTENIHPQNRPRLVPEHLREQALAIRH